MPVVNATIAAIFEQIADLLDIQGANPFRIRAYRNAARTIGGLGSDVKTLLEKGADLRDLPGIGDDLAAKMREIVETGKSVFLASSVSSCKGQAGFASLELFSEPLRAPSA